MQLLHSFRKQRYENVIGIILAFLKQKEENRKNTNTTTTKETTTETTTTNKKRKGHVFIIAQHRVTTMSLRVTPVLVGSRISISY